MRYQWEVKGMRYGCGGGGGWSYGGRSFLTKEEKLAMLKEYKEDLEKEVAGVEERIKELSAK
ncbi:MAG: DUF5320 domain-containing protein [Thermoproteota archaeon]|nr:DUF5320 domain-containing protein [Thermoproteota archaeon]